MDIGDIRDRVNEYLDDHDVPVLVGGAVLGLVLGAVVTLLVVSPNSHTSGGTDQARLSGALPSATPSAQHRTPPDRMKRCIDAASALELPLRKAASSVDQWEVHVGAMNKLVVGAITLRQATAFWNQTRVGARHRIAELDRAWAHLQRRGVDCPPPAMLPSAAPHELRSCAREVALDLRVLHAARTAIDTWRRHVRAMDMLRMGKMSPSTASQMWLAMWHRGQHEIDMYRVAAHAAREVSGPGCPSSAG
jgi:hypothetical protein